MRNNEIIFVDDLVDAIREKWREENHAEGDPGHTTYVDMIRFIWDFAEKKGILGNNDRK